MSKMSGVPRSNFRALAGVVGLSGLPPKETTGTLIEDMPPPSGVCIAKGLRPSDLATSGCVVRAERRP